MQNEMNQGHDKRPLVFNREVKRTVAELVGTSIPKLAKSVPPGPSCLFLANIWDVWCGHCICHHFRDIDKMPVSKLVR